jgi:sugar O-acyltransferase (sialic acid O-acetyltransferase NeuD family)
MDERLILFGAGGHAKVVLEAFLARCPAGEVAVLDDDPARAGEVLLGHPIRGGRDWLSDNWPGIAVIAALGDNRRRDDLIQDLKRLRRPLRTIIHPNAVVSPSARIGDACFLAAGAIVNAEAVIDEGSILNTGAGIDHDCRIGRAAHIAPGAHLCGTVTIGARALIGTGAAIIPGRSVGEDARIGAASAVVCDVPAGEIWAGCPARRIR